MHKQIRVEASLQSRFAIHPVFSRIRSLSLHGLLLASLIIVMAGSVHAANWKIGELNSYADFPEFANGYRQGWQLAVDEINAAGGIAQRQLEVISVDDGAARRSATRRAQELIVNHEVDLLAGTFLSDVGLAVSSVAAKNRKVFIAAGPQSDTLTWHRGNRYTFRLRPSTYMQVAMLVELAAAMPAQRWAIVAPNYEYGQSAVANFRTMLKARRPDVVFVGEQWPALGKLDAPSVMSALARARPDAVFNATFGADLLRLLRESRRTRVFEQARLVSMDGSDSEIIKTLRGTALAGWMVAGLPASGIDRPEYTRFRQAFRGRFGSEPQLPALIGYSMIQAIAQALRQAQSAESDVLIDTLRGLEFEAPVGPIRIRAIDHQATMGAFIGRLAPRSETAVEWRYLDGANYLPDEEFVRSNRPASAMR